MPLVELVRTLTRDGLRLDGALASHSLSRPQGETRNEDGAANSASRPTAALLLHGVAGNFYTSSTFEPLIAKLQEIGLAVLSANTRGHDSVFGATLGNVRRRMGAAYETVDDCRLDVAAWIEFLKNRGHPRVVLIGHSLGAVKAVYSQSHEEFAEVAAVVSVSAPRLSYSAFMNSAESSLFWESIHTAEQMAKAGRGDELFTGKFPVPMLITAAGYIDKYGPAERYNLLKFAAAVPCPALFLYGTRELSSGGVAFAGLPEALLALPHPQRRQIVVIEGADHFYSGTADQLAEAVGNWVISH